MNIYKTKNGCYINMENVEYIQSDIYSVLIHFKMGSSILELKNDEAHAFLDYLDKYLDKVFAGYA